MKVAYFCEPQVGGTYTFFRSLHVPLRERGVEFRCVAPMREEDLAGSVFAGDEGVDVLGVRGKDPAFTTCAVDFLRREKFGGVMVLANVYDTRSVMRELGDSVFKVARLPHNARGVYEPAVRLSPYVDCFVGVSDRLRDDLVQRYGVAAERVRVIYHGVDTALFCPSASEGSGDREPSCLYVGRLEDGQKHVTLLPRIVRELERRHGLRVRLSVVGEGPDLDAVERVAKACGVRDRVRMLGRIRREALPGVYRRHELFFLPSRFEGCGFSLIEGMSCGCVPVVSHIRGIFDRIVEEGKSGFLCRVGDERDFARCAARVLSDGEVLLRLRTAARDRVLERFSLERMADDYAELFLRRAKKCGAKRAGEGGMLECWDAGMLECGNAGTGGRVRVVVSGLLPRGLKNWIRTQAERRGWSI